MNSPFNLCWSKSVSNRKVQIKIAPRRGSGIRIHSIPLRMWIWILKFKFYRSSSLSVKYMFINHYTQKTKIHDRAVKSSENAYFKSLYKIIFSEWKFGKICFLYIKSMIISFITIWFFFFLKNDLNSQKINSDRQNTFKRAPGVWRRTYLL